MSVEGPGPGDRRLLIVNADDYGLTECVAKAILDAIKGYVFHDDAQVARLLVERSAGERERITVTVRKIGELAREAP